MATVNPGKADDKLFINESSLTAIANAIRAKSGKSAKLSPAQMATEIAAIETGGGGAAFEFGGMNATKVATYDETFTLADTSFVVGESASTSSTSIKAAVSNRFTSPSIAIGDKDVIVVQTVDVVPAHGASAVNKAKQERYSVCHVTNISKRRTVGNAAKNTRQALAMNTYVLFYRNSTGSITTATAQYGFYATPATASAASTTAASTTVRVNSPTLGYRVSSTYESAANIKLVTDCEFRWHVDVYLVDPGSSVAHNVLATAYDMALVDAQAIIDANS